MSQKTLVLKVPKAGHAALRARLADGDFEFRPVPHSVFSAKGAGVVATLYSSGKFVIQGQNPELFLARFTDLDAPAGAEPAKERSAPRAAPEKDRIAAVTEPVIGSDETGKGDYFGPLVVCAVRLDPEEARELTAQGVMDSKQLTDRRAMQLGALLRARVPYALRVLDPPEYNAAHQQHANVNTILAELHSGAIRELAETGIRVIVDQFAPKKRMEQALAGADVQLEQAHRAERNPAVAAASILARQEFLVRMLELSSEFGIDLKKGAGAQVDAAGARFVKEHGTEALGKVAKLHFKNTRKVMARVR